MIRQTSYPSPVRELRTDRPTNRRGIAPVAVPALGDSDQKGAIPLPTAPKAPKVVHDRVASKELGLACGYRLGKHFFGCEDLHYGLWLPGVPVDFNHLREAQSEYSEFLLSRIPADVESVLDVGCGSGTLARQLIQRGFHVDCVSPSPFLTPIARDKLGEAVNFYQCKFEDLPTDGPQTAGRYDAILFSESFQYLNMTQGLAQCQRLLRPGGYLVISDFFQKETTEKSPIGGGQRLVAFREQIAALPFDCLDDFDITEQTAPTMQVVHEMMTDAIGPIWEMTQQVLEARHPWIWKIVRRIFRRKLERLEWKHLSGARNAASFAKFKSYRVTVHQKRAVS